MGWGWRIAVQTDHCVPWRRCPCREPTNRDKKKPSVDVGFLAPIPGGVVGWLVCLPSLTKAQSRKHDKNHEAAICEGEDTTINISPLFSPIRKKMNKKSTACSYYAISVHLFPILFKPQRHCGCYSGNKGNFDTFHPLYTVPYSSEKNSTSHPSKTRCIKDDTYLVHVACALGFGTVGQNGGGKNAVWVSERERTILLANFAILGNVIVLALVYLIAAEANKTAL